MKIDIQNGTVFLVDPNAVTETIEQLPKVYMVWLKVNNFEALSARKRADLMQNFPFELTKDGAFMSIFFVQTREHALELSDKLRDIGVVRRANWYIREVMLIPTENFFTFRKTLRTIIREAGKSVIVHPLLKGIAEKNVFSVITELLKNFLKQKPSLAFT